MKTKNFNRRLSFMSLFMITMIVAGVHGVKAQDMLDDTEDLLQDGSAVQMDDINIDGHLSPSEQLRKRREKLEERNKLMVEKKIEDIRVKQEIALTNNLNKAFTTGLSNLDEKKEDKVEVKQAAPVIAPQPVVAPIVETKIIEVPAPVKVQKDSKVIASLGALAMKGDNIDFESKLNLNLSAENHVTPNISVGIALGYTSLDITDTANTFVGTGYGTYYNTNYNNNYGNAGRAISYSKFNVDVNSKFFLSVDSKIKPFVGGALGYNRSSISYNDNNTNYTANNVTFGNEGSTSGNITAGAKLGAELDFNENVGLNLDLSYTKAITSGISSKAQTTDANPDQLRLSNITKAMEQSDVTAIQVGVAIRF